MLKNNLALSLRFLQEFHISNVGMDDPNNVL